MPRSAQGLRIEYMPLGKLARAPRNPKAHDLGTLQQSLGRFGYVAPVLIDERTGHLVAGHGRVEALERAKAAGQAPPARVQVRDGEWLVPVVRGVGFADEREAEAYLLADNQLTIAAGWGDGLENMLRELRDADALLGTGFSDTDLGKLFRRSLVEDAPARPDLAGELQRKWGVERGQLWAVGDHRVLCGDATAAGDVERLTGGERAVLMATDPPYGVSYDAEWRGRAGLNPLGANRTGKVAHDDEADWAPAWRLAPADVAYVWHASAFADVVMASLRGADFQVRQQIIWRKPAGVLSRSAYNWQREPCWYAVRRGSTANFQGGFKQTTVWDADPPNQIFAASTDDRTEHPTQKPIQLYSIPIENHVPRGGLVYEPFAGSGTAIVASERLGRRCYAMEIEPKYVAVILERLASMGLTPGLVA
jgi:DNA modification methylase